MGTFQKDVGASLLGYLFTGQIWEKLNSKINNDKVDYRINPAWKRVHADVSKYVEENAIPQSAKA